MITEFDKNGAAALYKREFAKSVKSQSFEDAIDYLIKFSEETVNPDFHKALGMLYLLMAQDSDDKEFLSMAYREFMMYLRREPDSATAYRDLLAASVMRREPAAVIDCSEWIRSRGYDVDSMFDELSEAGVDIFNEDSEFMYIEGMYKEGEFGLIDSDRAEDGANKTAAAENPTAKPSKIIRFRGAAETVGHAEVSKTANKITPIGMSDECENALDAMLRMTGSDGDFDNEGYEDEYDENDDLFTSAQKLDSLFLRDLDENMPTSLRVRVALRNAESFCEKGDYDKALEVLGTIGKEDKQIYYCAECVRAYIFLERGELSDAHDALDAALSVNETGALAGTLLCTVYELEHDYDKIPQTLKNIDVYDYSDADHVYKAMRLAIKYCTPDDVIELAQEYNAEFNIIDVRQLYAQVLYNSGRRAEGIKELYKLSRIMYDDFNIKYYYLMARSGAESLPIDEEAPQQALSMIVDSIIVSVQNRVLTDDILNSDAFSYGLEVFLTLEYRNDKKTMLLMFDTLRRLAADVRLDDKMRDALVSPYVEPIVKAIILSELLKRSDRFLVDVMYRPNSDDSVATLDKGYPIGCYTAYAFTLLFGRSMTYEFTEKTKKLVPLLSEGKGACDLSDDENRDIAYYLYKNVRKDGKRGSFRNDDRIEYALGYPTKAAATSAYKAIDERISAYKRSQSKKLSEEISNERE